MIPVYLRPADVEWATSIGKTRWARSKKRKSKARFANAKEVDHIDGAGGELAFARALGLTWSASVDVYHSLPDVFPNWEVRTLRRLRGVKVVPEDDNEALVVWVAGEMPAYKIMGYCRAEGARRRQDWYSDPGNKGRPIWLVPPQSMVPIDADFHRQHGYWRGPWDLWECAFCGAPE